jgi:hypothetical protein
MGREHPNGALHQALERLLVNPDYSLRHRLVVSNTEDNRSASRVGKRTDQPGDRTRGRGTDFELKVLAFRLFKKAQDVICGCRHEWLA